MNGNSNEYPYVNESIKNYRDAEPMLLMRRLLREYFNTLKGVWQHDERKLCIRTAKKHGFNDLANELSNDL